LEANHATNLTVKEELATQAEALLPITDLGATKKALRTITEKWEKAGTVGKKDKDRLDGRIRAVEHAIRDAEQHEWHRTDPAARARAEDAVRQLSDAIDGYLKQSEKATKAGNEKKANEALAAAEARREWLAEAERTLAEFSR
jgi:ribosomal protein S20